MIREGNGFVIQSAHDTPWAGWFSLQKLDWADLIHTCPSLFMVQLGEMMDVLPGGVHILWDLPETHGRNNAGCLALLESMLQHLPKLSLHIKSPLSCKPIVAPANVWLHSSEIPTGDLGDAWRNGLIGWVPQTQNAWSLPGFGSVLEDLDGCANGMIWGEITIPASAVGHLDAESLRLAIENTQGHIERAMSHRSNAGAWPQPITFQRRQAAWRLTLTGGWEFQLSGQPWEKLASELLLLQSDLISALRCNIHIGANHDAIVAGILAEQAMKYGSPWRNTLSPPPAPASFTPGIAADPRKESTPEARASFPKPMAPVLTDPPVAFLRVPEAPSTGGIQFFMQNLEAPPAIRWLPPGMPPPGPFHSDIHWSPAESFPGIGDGKTSQAPLFDWEE
jgi:hypothetical protein